MADSPAPSAEAPIAHLNVVDDLVLVADVVSSLRSRGILLLGADGHYAFVNPSSQAVVSEAADIEALVKLHGVEVPDNFERVINSLGVVLPLIGVK